MVERLQDILHGGMLAVFVNYMVLLLYSTPNNSKVPKKIRYIAGLLMALLAAETTLWFICSLMGPNADGSPRISNQEANIINFLVVPICVVLFTEITGYRNVTLKTLLLHMLPFIALIIAYSTGLRTIGDSSLTGFIYNAYMIGLAGYSIPHIIIFYRVIKKHNEEVMDFYSNTEGRTLEWMRGILYLLLSMGFIYVVLYIFLGTTTTMLAYNFLCIIFWATFAMEILKIQSTEEMKQSNASKEPQGTEIQTGTKEGAAGAEPEDPDLKAFMDSLREVCIDGKLYCQESITRDDVAAAMFTNHTTLTNKLKRATGMTFSEYIGSIRLEEAVKMMLASNEQMEQIIFACGYRNKSTFYRAFSHKYGCTPNEYRKQNRQ